MKQDEYKRYAGYFIDLRTYQRLQATGVKTGHGRSYLERLHKVANVAEVCEPYVADEELTREAVERLMRLRKANRRAYEKAAVEARFRQERKEAEPRPEAVTLWTYICNLFRR